LLAGHCFAGHFGRAFLSSIGGYSLAGILYLALMVFATQAAADSL
jgi:hypothetical protein